MANDGYLRAMKYCVTNVLDFFQSVPLSPGHISYVFFFTFV